VTTPLTGRPEMPGYGVPDSNEDALPWSWAEERLVNCRNYFVATTRPDGRPHVMPVWGNWIHDMFVFSTAITSVKSKNLLANPNCVVTIEDGHESVIVEGVAKIVEMADVPDFIAAYKDKYGYELDPDKKWAIEPKVAFAFIEDDTFSKTATRWRWSV
jgi:hypothetical protein